MIEEAKHTETPWMITNMTDVWPDDRDRKGRRHIAAFMPSDDGGVSECAANAKFAVRACNLHARLVEMLELLENIEDSAGFFMCPICFRTNGRHEPDCKLDALLAEARGDK